MLAALPTTELMDFARADPKDALKELLARWERTRHPAIADAIEILSKAVGGEPIAADSVQEAINAWNVAADRADALTLGPVLTAFPIGLIANGIAQLEHLTGRSDPRIPHRLLRLLDDPPFRSLGALGFWKDALRIVEEVRDPRSVSELERQRDRAEAEFAPPMGRLIRREIQATLERMRGRVPTPEPNPDAEALLEALEERYQSDKLAEELLAEVYAQPQDVEARLIYADRLLESGDPRGELIILQCSGGEAPPSKEQRQREKELLAKHGVEWLGDLAPVLLKTGLVYKRGFVDSCIFKTKNRVQAERLIGHPAWSTVRSITVNSNWNARREIDRLLLDPVMMSLREIHGYTSPELFRGLCLSRKERPLTSLMHDQLRISPRISWSASAGWTELPPEGPAFDREEQLCLTECPGLPNLRYLALYGWGRIPPRYLRWFLNGKLAQRLETLHLANHVSFLPAWLEELADHPLPELVFGWEREYASYRVRRDDRGRLSRLTASFKKTTLGYYVGERRASPFDDFMDALERMPLDLLTTVDVSWSKKSQPTDLQLARFEQLLSRRPLDVCLYPGA